MNSKHTPGPWFIVWEEDGDNDSGGYGTYHASEIVSGSPESSDYVDLLSKRNAPLVAAAPEMLAALLMVSAAREGQLGDITVQAVQAAIAKATEPPPSAQPTLPHSNK